MRLVCEVASRAHVFSVEHIISFVESVKYVNMDAQNLSVLSKVRSSRAIVRVGHLQGHVLIDGMWLPSSC